MKKQMKKIIAACIGLLAFGFATAGDLQVTSLGNCISQLEEEGDLAIKICEARRARASMKPGSSGCAALSRVDSGGIRCSKSDAASERTSTRPVFSRYDVTLNSPVSIGDFSAFYGDRSAGANARFRVTRGSDGRLEIVDRESSEDDASGCKISLNGLRCNAIKVRVPIRVGSKTRTQYVYTLRMDGLMVERYRQRGVCIKPICVPNGCFNCGRYVYTPPSLLDSQMHSWN